MGLVFWDQPQVDQTCNPWSMVVVQGLGGGACGGLLIANGLRCVEVLVIGISRYTTTVKSTYRDYTVTYLVTYQPQSPGNS